MIDSPLLPELDRLFCRLDPGWDAECSAWLARLVDANGQGHVCLPLDDAAASRRLRASPLVGRPGDYAPLIFDPVAGLYFARQWFDETRLAEGLRARAALTDTVAAERLAPLLDRLFPANGDRPDRQKLAAALAARQRLLVISGGPGTGKTTTVVRLMALLAQLAATPPAMALAAPTGKAAARLSESVRGALAGLPLTADLLACLPDRAQTLHRLLGLRPGGARPRYHARHPLPLDVLVIDEASMIDLGLMAQTLDALPPGARLILLGDRDQLSSVDAGAVLGDLCSRVTYRQSTLDWLAALGFPDAALPAADDGATGLADAVALLTVSHRFSADSGIGALSRAVNQGNAAAARALLDDGTYPDLAHDATLDGEALYHQRDAYWQQVAAGDGPAGLSAAFNGFMVLAAERRQVEALNQAVEMRLEREGRKPVGQPWYPGRPVMIAANDYALGLFNGDIGFTVVRDGGLRVAFADADGGWRELSPARLPDHETVYAMTVHKSQGSEFDEVWLALPETLSPLADRALVYTAITRARRRFRVLGDAGLLSAAIAQQSGRHTGLAARLSRP